MWEKTGGEGYGTKQTGGKREKVPVGGETKEGRRSSALLKELFFSKALKNRSFSRISKKPTRPYEIAEKGVLTLKGLSSRAPSLQPWTSNHNPVFPGY